MDQDVEFLSATLADVVECLTFFASSAMTADILTEDDAKGLAGRMKSIAGRVENGANPDSYPGTLVSGLHALALLLEAYKREGGR